MRVAVVIKLDEFDEGHHQVVGAFQSLTEARQYARRRTISTGIEHRASTHLVRPSHLRRGRARSGSNA